MRSRGSIGSLKIDRMSAIQTRYSTYKNIKNV